LERRTRIVATLGPATDKPGVLEALLESGLDVARINFAHGSVEELKARITRLRALADPLPRPVAVLLDLPGPKLRALLDVPLSLIAGQEVSLAAAPRAAGQIRVTEPEALVHLKADQRVLMDDGRLQLRVHSKAKDTVVLQVTVGGTLMPNKGMNLPDTDLAIPAVTPRDRAALALAASVSVDWLGLSFVRSAHDAQELRDVARTFGLRLPVIAKIERPEAVEHAGDIIDAFDGIMVARGDLGVEIDLENVPHVQKHLINLARVAAKPVITATDMLDSMRSNPRPTRAEASDVANAVYDGTGAVMLSGETAAGQYPVEAFQTMDRIVRQAEAHFQEDPLRDLPPAGGIEDHISRLTCRLAADIHADAIITPAFSGRTARLVSRHRPRIPIVVPVAHDPVYRQMALVWGLRAVRMKERPTAPDRIEKVVQAAFHAGAVPEGALVVVLAGHPIEGGERFPTIRVVRVGPGGVSREP
jgi:pyruvate kinase